MRTTETILAEIRQQLGLVPPFFIPAFDRPELLESLWQQTLAASVDNPLPGAFRERLFAYLSRFCAVPYSAVCHGFLLHPASLPVRELLDVLESPTIEDEAASQGRHAILEQEAGPLVVWPSFDPDLEDAVFHCAVHLFSGIGQTRHCGPQLRRLLGTELYEPLMRFLSYVKTCHIWVEAHPELALDAHKLAQEHLAPLLQRHAPLAAFFRAYPQKLQAALGRHAASSAAAGAASATEQQRAGRGSSDARFQALFEALAIGTAITDLQGRILEANAKFQAFTGRRLAELWGWTLEQLSVKQDAGEDVAALAERLAAGHPETVERRFVRKDGELVWGRLTRSFLPPGPGKPAAIAAMVEDVTERKQAEEAPRQPKAELPRPPEPELRDPGPELRDLEARLRSSEAAKAELQATVQALQALKTELLALLAAVPETLLVLDAEGRYLRIAPTAPLGVERTPRAYLGKRLHDVLPAEKADLFLEHIRQALQEHEPRQLEYSLEVQGAERSFLAVVSPKSEDSVVWASRILPEHAAAGQELLSDNERLAARVSELEQRAKEMTHVHKTGELLQSALSVHELHDLVAHLGQQLFPADAGMVYVVRPEKDLAELIAGWGEPLASEPAFHPEDCWGLRRARPYSVDAKDSRMQCRHRRQPLATPYVCVPMLVHGEAVGVLYLQATRAPPLGARKAPAWFNKSRQRMAVAAADQLALALSNLIQREALSQQAMHAPLSRLFSRGSMDELLERELRRAIRKQRNVSVLMLEVDRFKPLRDALGPVAADRLLRELGEWLQALVRADDLAGAYEEARFVLILPECSLADALKRAEQVRTACKGHRFAAAGSQPISLSIGMATYPEHGASSTELLRMAELSLQRARAQGRGGIDAGPAAAKPPSQKPSAE
jgi:diguanylate cyclase (GGDEF)-like protein/PAS domain S-box-containing protein